MVDVYRQSLSDVVVIGGGNTGWTTALYIKHKYPESNVTVLASSEIGTVGVGEGTTPNYFHLLQSLGFSERTLFKELKATKKTGILFKNWNKDIDTTYYHNFSDMKGNYDYAIHLDTNATTNFLMKEGMKRGIKLIDAKYLTHLNNSDLHVKEIVTDKGNIKCSFVFDCSGFKRVMIGKWEDVKWNSYTDHLKVNEGITFTLKNGSQVNHAPQGEPLQFGNAPRGVIFDSASNQWNQEYINGRFYKKNKRGRCSRVDKSKL